MTPVMKLINLQRLITIEMKSYQAAINYLYKRLPVFHRIGPAAYKNSLENTQKLDELYDSPHRHFSTLHVGGTNGKGSVSHMLASILQSAGYRTGLYTSPHLKDFRERIRINGRMIPKISVIRWINHFLELNQTSPIEPSFFELTVAMAFDYFAREKVEIAVIEVGLGGRLDSTNIISPEVSVITNISFDHQALLGDTLAKIAGEKAGIIKPGIPVVVSQWQPEVAEVFIQKGKDLNAPVCFAGLEYSAEYGLLDLEGKQVLNVKHNNEMAFPQLKIDLQGNYQRLNVPAVLKTVELLISKGWKIPVKAVYEGLAKAAVQTGLQGRWQIIGYNPLVICDTGHNEDGIRQVTEQLKQMAYKKLHFVIGVVSDKDPAPALSLLPKEARYYFTKADIPRALDENILKQKAMLSGLTGDVYPTVIKAFEAAKSEAGRHDLIFVGGSTFTVAEIL
jgi:dihydrofolate synthase / folylpolyglutamate synthase